MMLNRSPLLLLQRCRQIDSLILGSMKIVIDLLMVAGCLPKLHITLQVMVVRLGIAIGNVMSSVDLYGLSLRFPEMGRYFQRK